MPRISFIIPVYNTGKYIKRCLDSIFNQIEPEDIEVIVINDGSTDNSDELINQYIEKSNKKDIIKYYKKENEGVAKARNFGIEKATAKYILFVDSDDYISKETLEVLHPHIDKDIDMIKFKLQKFDSYGKILERVGGPTFETTTGQDAFTKLYSEDVLLDSPTIYLIKKELFTKNNLQFQGRYHEDFGLIPILILLAKTFISLPDYLYYYMQVENSITRSNDYDKTIKRMEDVFFHYDRMLKIIDTMQLEQVVEEDVKIYYTNAILSKMKDLKKEDRKRFMAEVKKRKMYQNIKARNVKQFIKRMLLMIGICPNLLKGRV